MVDWMDGIYINKYVFTYTHFHISCMIHLPTSEYRCISLSLSLHIYNMDHRHRHNNDVEEEHRVVVHKGELVPTFCNFIPTIHLVFKSDLQPFWLHRCPLLELLSCCILLANSDPKKQKSQSPPPSPPTISTTLSEKESE